MINALIKMRAYLLAQSAITDAVGTRVFVEGLSPDLIETWTKPWEVQKSIIIDGDLTRMDGAPIIEGTLEVITLGASMDAAHDLAVTVHGVLDGLSREAIDSECEIKACDQEVEPEFFLADDTDWNAFLTHYGVQVLDKS